MKKSLIALAVMAAAGAASAQSSVTLFGIVDLNISRYSVNNGQSLTALANSGYNSSRLGFRGTEDLGGGLAASFWIEGSLAPDNGNASGLTFTRRSTVSLAGGWGELRLGRDYTPTFWNMTVFDAFGTNGVGSQIGHKVKLAGTSTGTTYGNAFDPAYVRSDNMVQYFLPPNLGGIYGQISYGFDEKPAGSQGQFVGGRIGYAAGPFNVAAAYSETDGTSPQGFPVAPATTPAPDVKDWNIGGQWDFGMLKLLGVYDEAKYDGGASGTGKLKSYTIGLLVPVGAGEIKGSYGHAKLDTPAAGGPNASQWAIGYVHNLSKRTALYATYAHVSNSDGSPLPVNASLNTTITGIANQSSSGFDIGLRHSF